MSVDMIVNCRLVEEHRVMGYHVVNAIDVHKTTLTVHPRRVSSFVHIELCAVAQSLLDRLRRMPSKDRLYPANRVHRPRPHRYYYRHLHSKSSSTSSA